MSTLDVASEQTTALGRERATPAGRPKLSALLILGFVALGAVLLVLALEQAFAWDLVAYVLGACVAGAAASLVFNDVLVRKLAGTKRLVIAGAGTVVTAVGVALLELAVFNEWSGMAAADVIVLAVGLIVCNLALKGDADGGWHGVAGGGAVMLAAAVGMWAGSWGSWGSWVALLVWMVALTVLKLRFGPWLDADRSLVRPALVVSIVVAVGGAVMLGFAAARHSEFWVIMGVTLAVAGLSAAGICGSRNPLGSSVAVVALVVGVAGIVACWVKTVQLVQVGGIASVLALAMVIVGAWFVFRGEAFILVVLIGGVVAWGLVDRNGEALPAASDGVSARIIGIGDSFISGEGAENFIAGTNTLGSHRNECRRATTAYTYLLAERTATAAVLLACSGAETDDILHTGDHPDVGQMPDSPPGIPGARKQIDELAELQPGDGDVVLLSIGGNDVGFSSIVKACLLPSPCDDTRARIWLDRVESLYPILLDTYQQVRAAAGDAVVIVVPYPNFVPPDRCGVGLSQSEHRFVQAFITTLDDTITRAATEAGVEVFGGSQTVFASNRLCDAKPAANHLQLRPPDGPNFSRFAVGKWAHGPMHPNERGHELLANALEPSVRAALGPAGANPAPVVPEAADAGPDISVATAEATVGDIADDDWITQRLYETFQKLLLPLVGMLGFAVLAAAGFVQRPNKLARFLAP